MSVFMKALERFYGTVLQAVLRHIRFDGKPNVHVIQHLILILKYFTFAILIFKGTLIISCT